MIGELIGDWIKGILIDGIMGNLSGLFSTVNTKVGEIASDVGATPQAWNSGIFNKNSAMNTHRARASSAATIKPCRKKDPKRILRHSGILTTGLVSLVTAWVKG